MYKQMLTDQKQTSIKRTNKQFNTSEMMSPSSKSIFRSPGSKNVLQEQLNELQLLSQQEVVQRLKAKKQEVMRQSEEITQNCHRYFMQLTNVLMEVESGIKKRMDEQTLSFLEEIESKIECVRENEHSYNCNSQVYNTLKLLLRNYTQTQQQMPQVKKMISRCYSVTLSGFAQTASEMSMPTSENKFFTTDNKIYISGNEFITTSKKIHGNSLQVSEREFELALAKFEEREEKQVLVNERLRNKVKTLEEMLSKKGLNVKEFNRSMSAGNERMSQDYWDLELERVRGENAMLTLEITQLSNKLIGLTSQNQALKGDYRKIIQSNMGQISNQSNTLYEGGISTGYENLLEHSRLETNNFMPSQTVISSTMRELNIKEEEVTSGVFIQSSMLQKEVQSEMLAEYEKRTEQLSVELTRRLREIEQLQGSFQQKDKQIQQLTQHLQSKSSQLSRICNELQRLTDHSSRLEHDYDVSSKKRFELEERVVGLRQEVKEWREKETYSGLQAKTQVENLQALLKMKEEDVARMVEEIQAKVKLEQQAQHKQLKMKYEALEQQISWLKQSLTDSKSQHQNQLSKFKQQFKRQQQTITSKDHQISTLMQQLYHTTKLNNQTQQDNSLTFKEKYQTNKKELAKIKKQFKDKNKQLDSLRPQLDKLTELLNLKAVQVAAQVSTLARDLDKLRSNYQSKVKLLEEKVAVMREKHQLHLQQLIALPTGQNKRSIVIELIQKYTEAMNSYAQKTAQLKKLKEQLKELKTTKITLKYKKQPKDHQNLKSKDSQTLKIPQTIKNPQTFRKNLQNNQQQLTQMQISIREDRIKIQKSIFEEKLAILDEEKTLLSKNLQAKQKHLKTLELQNQKLKKQLKSFQQTLKKQSNQQQLKSQLRSLQIKNQKLDSQLKSTKHQLKKSLDQLSAIQTELKKKKDHITNVKKELTSNSDQFDELNFLLKIKSQEVQKLKRQLKDQSTKQTLLNQMKQKVQAYQQLQAANQQLKKQIDKNNSATKFQINKLNTQIKELKAERREEISQKVSSKVETLNEELNDLKTKNKKLKTQLQRKQALTLHLKSKADAELAQAQLQLQQNVKQLQKKIKLCQNLEKKLDAVTSNLRKYKQKSKLLTVILQKLYSRMLNDKSKPKPNLTSNKENTLLHNTSPISQAITSNLFNSNLFNNTVSPSVTKHKEPSTLETFKQFDINLEDLEKYSQGLEMFGVNTCQFKNLHKENGLDFRNENSTISYLMTSPEGKNDRAGSNNFVRSRINGWDTSLNGKDQNIKMHNSEDTKEKVHKLSECLNNKEEIDVAQVLFFFDQIIQDSQ